MGKDTLLRVATVGKIVRHLPLSWVKCGYWLNTTFWEETKSEKNYLNSTYGRKVFSYYSKSGKSKFRISKKKTVV
jgi:hypothetical protein